MLHTPRPLEHGALPLRSLLPVAGGVEPSQHGSGLQSQGRGLQEAPRAAGGKEPPGLERTARLATVRLPRLARPEGGCDTHIVWVQSSSYHVRCELPRHDDGGRPVLGSDVSHCHVPTVMFIQTTARLKWR
jgi:hypothetical protein